MSSMEIQMRLFNASTITNFQDTPRVARSASDFVALLVPASTFFARRFVVGRFFAALCCQRIRYLHPQERMPKPLITVAAGVRFARPGVA